MFERCTYLGGNPGLASDIIGNNFRKIIHLRKSKYQSVKQFSGTMYGLAGGMALTLFTVHGVTNMINKLYAGLNMGQVMNLIHVVPSEDMNIVAYLMYASLILYSMFSAYLIKMMDGGHPQVVLVHFVIMVWVVSIVACVTGYVLDIVLGTTISIA
jgi:flagellar protein FlaJ